MVVVFEVPSGEVVLILRGSAACLLGSIDAMARTCSPEEPELPKKGPVSPLFPADMVTTTPFSTMREAMTAHGLFPHPSRPPIEEVMIST